MRFLTPEDIKDEPQDKRCIVCLERQYIFWLKSSGPEPAGCPMGHTRKEDCKEIAVSGAKFRSQIDELRQKGLLPK